MREAELQIKDIKNGAFSPIYILHGEEPFFIDLVVEAIDNNLLTEDQKSFDRHVFYGKEAKWLDILSLAKQYPMFGEKQLVLVKEAQLLKDDIDRLTVYADSFAPQTVLVIVLKGNLDKRSKLYKVVSTKGSVLSTKKLYDNQVPAFVQKQIQSYGWQAQAELSFLLAEHIGNNLTGIKNELNKIQTILPKGEVLTIELIEKYIGISKEYNHFELIDALAEKNHYKALKIILHFSKNIKDHPLMLVVALIYSYYNNLLLYHTLSDKSSSHVSTVLGIPPFLVTKYALGARNYSLKSVAKIIHEIRCVYGKAVGVNSTSPREGELLKALILSILSHK